MVIQATGPPGRAVTMTSTRRPKRLVEEEFRSRQQIASLCESMTLLVRPLARSISVSEGSPRSLSPSPHRISVSLSLLFYPPSPPSPEEGEQLTVRTKPRSQLQILHERQSLSPD
jgi:hypothetical protein